MLRDDRLLADFVSVPSPGARILIRRGHEAQVPLLRPSGLARARLNAESLADGGRVAHPIVVLPGGERVLIREYRRGGLMGKINRRHYFLGRRALQELRATVHAAAGGVRVPEVICAAEEGAGLAYRATLTTRWIEGVTDSARWLTDARPAERAALLQETGHQIALMHAAGVAHPDLNLRNLLVAETKTDSPPIVYLIDFDRAHLGGGPIAPARRARDLERLGRSARKLGLPLEVDDGWLELRSGYGKEWPLPDRG